MSAPIAASAPTPVPPIVKGWCPGALRPMATGDGLLVRLRVSGGALSADRLHAVATLARAHGNGLVDLSQRANLQLRGVTEATLPALLDALDRLGLLDPNPDAEAVRNVIAPPLAGLAPAPVDGTRLVRALEAALVARAALHALPDKVGFLVDDGGPVSLVDVATDIRLDARPDGTVRIALGGTAATAETAAVVPASDAVETALACAHAFLMLRHRCTPPARRMHDLVRQLGMSAVESAARAFRPTPSGFAAPSTEAPTHPSPQGKVDRREAAGRKGLSSPLKDHHREAMGRRDSSPSAASEPPISAAPAPLSGPALLGAHPFFLGVGAPFGRLTADQLDILAANAPAGVRLTPYRLVLLPGAEPSALATLAAAGLIVSPDDARLAVAACPGAPACPSGQADTRALAEALAPLARRVAAAGVTLHVSGCPKGCARPAPTAVVLVGRDGRYDGLHDGRADSAPAAAGLDPAGAADFLSRAIQARAIQTDKEGRS
ncbi:precorrin-3B synthase [Mongoliimonas terrestris]|uniref:precorrin-3B synthase n=1 Tax=Mongoliimonas terrestris TaxID=1709001 RepID=UPI000AA0B464|nr:precorrin-3B synthase [Mongoliimonas terrestris]